jgi:trans-2-enoyl-CoA reductase
MSGIIPPIPHYAFIAWCSVKKHRDTFTSFIQIQSKYKGKLYNNKSGEVHSRQRNTNGMAWVNAEHVMVDVIKTFNFVLHEGVKMTSYFIPNKYKILPYSVEQSPSRKADSH